MSVVPGTEPCERREGSKPGVEVSETNSPFGQEARPVLCCMAAARELSAVLRCDAVSADEQRSALVPDPC